MKTKKKKLPDFRKMTDDEIDRWRARHDLTDYMNQLRVVELDFDESGDVILPIRLPRTVKRKLDRAAKNRGLRGASTYARLVLTDHFSQAA